MLGENIKCTADFSNKSHDCEYLLANLTNLLVSLHLGQESYKIEIKQEYMTARTPDKEKYNIVRCLSNTCICINIIILFIILFCLI